MVGEACVQRGSLCTEGRLVYRGETCLQRGETSTEGETRLWRVRLVYGGGDSSIKGEARIGTILYEHLYVNIDIYIAVPRRLFIPALQ